MFVECIAGGQPSASEAFLICFAHLKINLIVEPLENPNLALDFRQSCTSMPNQRAKMKEPKSDRSRNSTGGRDDWLVRSGEDATTERLQDQRRRTGAAGAENEHREAAGAIGSTACQCGSVSK